MPTCVGVQIDNNKSVRRTRERYVVMQDNAIKLVPTRTLENIYREGDLFQTMRLFVETPVREIRQHCLEAIVTWHPASVGSRWIEPVIVQLGEVGETTFQERLLEWYVTKWCPRESHRAFIFLVNLQNVDISVRDRLVNYCLKQNPKAYWASDKLHQRYLEHFKSFTNGRDWVSGTLDQWRTMQRYARRIVEAGDAMYYELFRDWSSAYHPGRRFLLMGKEIAERQDRWAPNQIMSFLNDTVDFLRAEYQRQEINRGFAEAILEATIDGKEHGFTDPFEIKLEYPDTEIIARAVSERSTVEGHVRICDRKEHARDVEPLRKFISRIEIRLEIEGALNLTVARPECNCLLVSPELGVDWKICSFSFTPLASRQRVTFTFLLDGQTVGICVKYFQPKLIHVWS